METLEKYSLKMADLCIISITPSLNMF